jgi:5'-deoxynucleotidase YfbR-like HD superfamily hydrolase
MSKHWIQTFTGRRFDLLDPQPDMIHVGDIAHALSLLCRFTGHTRRFWSVASHSVLVSTIVPPEDAFAGLMHDAPEAYIGDVSSPLKSLLPEYKAIERGIWRAIADKFGIREKLPRSVKDADLSALMTERDYFFGLSPEPWAGSLEQIPRVAADFRAIRPVNAERRFMREFRKLSRGK